MAKRGETVLPTKHLSAGADGIALAASGGAKGSASLRDAGRRETPPWGDAPHRRAPRSGAFPFAARSARSEAGTAL